LLNLPPGFFCHFLRPSSLAQSETGVLPAPGALRKSVIPRWFCEFRSFGSPGHAKRNDAPNAR